MKGCLIFFFIFVSVKTELRHHISNLSISIPWTSKQLINLNNSVAQLVLNNEPVSSKSVIFDLLQNKTLKSDSLVLSSNGDNCTNLSYSYEIKEDKISDDAKAAKEIAKNLAEKVATLIQENSQTDRELESLLRKTLDKEVNIEAILVNITNNTSLMKNSIFLGYKRNNKIHFGKTFNFSTFDGVWISPFWNCLVDKWLFGYYGIIEKVGVGVFISIDHIQDNLDQCGTDGGPKCDLSTKCVPKPGSGYDCVCREGFYSPDLNSSIPYYNGKDVQFPNSSFRCVPCSEQCSTCLNYSQQCTVQPYPTLRYTVLSVQLGCILITFIISLLVFKHRKCKTIAAGMWIMLQTILLGAIILYITVVFYFFEPSVIRCLLESWFRELGFVICYGAIILKLYRILIEFRTRKAHRWVVRDKDLLKYLLGMIIVVFGYMAAWTAINLNLIEDENYDMLTIGRTNNSLHFHVCKVVWWDYVTEIGEILILIFGIHLCYASHNANTQFQERRFLCAAICVEAIFSGIFYILRFLYWGTIHPDYIFLAYFVRSQVTTSFVLLLVFAPKVWFQYLQINRTTGTSRHYFTQEYGRPPLEAFKPMDGCSDIEGEVNLADMNPEDIRAELKRLYTQLEVLKNKTIRMDNPHISKRRGGRKIAHRRFSLQKKGSKDKTLRQQAHRHSAKQHTDVEVTEAEVSRTPEDSVCSNEGPSIVINDGPSEVIYGTPRSQNK